MNFHHVTAGGKKTEEEEDETFQPIQAHKRTQEKNLRATASDAKLLRTALDAEKENWIGNRKEVVSPFVLCLSPSPPQQLQCKRSAIVSSSQIIQQTGFKEKKRRFWKQKKNRRQALRPGGGELFDWSGHRGF